MRPTVLNPLFADITQLDGVGPKFAALIEKVAGGRIIDLALTLPSGIIDRSHRPKIADTGDGEHATLTLHIDAHEPPPSDRPRSPYRVLCSDGSGFIRLVFFRAHRDWLNKNLPEGGERIISGKVEHYGNQRQMVHPDAIADPEAGGGLPLAEPIYPLTAGLPPKIMLRAVQGAVAKVPKLAEWQRPDVVMREDFPTFQMALRGAHTPETRLDLMPDAANRRRLAYDEFLASQLALALIRKQQRSAGGRAFRGNGALLEAAMKALPYTLTGDQQKVLQEVRHCRGRRARPRCAAVCG
ncbi:MAG: hypothetical protein AAF692_12545 [Pseudomonadota bacterium]